MVSIGVPTHNRAASLRRTLVSLMEQDYPHLEILVGDNASVDGTESVRREFSDHSQIIWSRRSTDCGPFRNFEMLLADASGEYFMWLADDDMISSSYISACVKLLETRPDVRVAVGRALYVTNGKVIREESRTYSQQSGCGRVLKYYRTVNGNPYFYGLMRRRDAYLGLPFGDPFVGMDWVHVARHVYAGKAVCASSERLTVTVYAAEDPARGDHSLGRGWPRQAFKMVFLARDAAADVLYDRTYGDLRLARRISFSVAIAALVSAHLTTRRNVVNALALTGRWALPMPVYLALRNQMRKLIRSL